MTFLVLLARLSFLVPPRPLLGAHQPVACGLPLAALILSALRLIELATLLIPGARDSWAKAIGVWAFAADLLRAANRLFWACLAAAAAATLELILAAWLLT